MAIFSTGFTPQTMTSMLMDAETRDPEGNPLHLILYVAGKTVFVKDIWEINGILFFEIENIELAMDGNLSHFPLGAKTIIQLRKETQWWGSLFKGALIHTIHTHFLQGMRKQILLRQEQGFKCLSAN